MMIFRRLKIVGAATALLCALPALANAQWPNRPIMLVVPFTAGGSPDVLSRVMAQDLGERLGQRVVVENRTGASGNIGTASVAKAAPDGYTFLVATPNPLVINRMIEGTRQQFDPDKDLTPIVILGMAASIFVTSPKSGLQSLQEIIATGKASPGKLNIGVPGLGTSSHIAVELLSQLTGAKFTIVPYRGPPPLSDVIGGQIDVAINSTAGYASAVRVGALRPLAVTSLNRSALLPDVATVAELGLKDFTATTWWILMAPADTPAAIVGRMNQAVNDFLKSDTGKKTFAQFDIDTGGGTALDAKAYIASEIAKWGPVVKAANFKM